MITKQQRFIIKFLVRLNIWHLGYQMRNIDVKATHFKWLKRWMLKRQIVDSLHHAPACPANHFHNTRFVFQYCTCGANKSLESEN